MKTSNDTFLSKIDKIFKELEFTNFEKGNEIVEQAIEKIKIEVNSESEINNKLIVLTSYLKTFRQQQVTDPLKFIKENEKIENTVSDRLIEWLVLEINFWNDKNTTVSSDFIDKNTEQNKGINNLTLVEFLELISGYNEIKVYTILINSKDSDKEYEEVEIKGTISFFEESGSKIPGLEKIIKKIKDGNNHSFSEIEIHNYLKKITNNFNEIEVKIVLKEMEVFESMILLEEMNAISLETYTENGWKIPLIEFQSLLTKEKCEIPNYKELRGKVFPYMLWNYNYAKRLLTDKLKANKIVELDNKTKSKDNTGKAWFRLGLLFAKGEMNKYYNENKKGISTNYTAPKIARELDDIGLKKYISGTLTGYSISNTNSDKNIFNSPKNMKEVISYCDKNDIIVVKDFRERFDKIETD